MLNNGLEFYKAQMKQNAHTSSNRHASGTRIELMDSTVPIEALVSGVIHPR